MWHQLLLDSFEWIEEKWSFIHITNIKQALNYELELKKVRRAIKFNQKA